MDDRFAYQLQFKKLGKIWTRQPMWTRCPIRNAFLSYHLENGSIPLIRFLTHGTSLTDFGLSSARMDEYIRAPKYPIGCFVFRAPTSVRDVESVRPRGSLCREVDKNQYLRKQASSTYTDLRTELVPSISQETSSATVGLSKFSWQSVLARKGLSSLSFA